MIAFIEDHRAVHGVEPIGHIPPAEAEDRFYADLAIGHAAA